MRLTLFFLCIQITQCFAVEAYAQSQKFTLRLENGTVGEILHEIERSSDFVFFYADGAVELDRRVDLDVRDLSIEQILHVLFDKTANTWTVNDRQVIINRAAAAQQPAAPVRVTGRVHDENGKPLAGANVIIKGTNIGSVTDANGEFVLVAPTPQAVVAISFLGMKPVEELLGGRDQIRVILLEDAAQLSEVVVTGYQTISKERSAGSYSLVSGDDVAERVSLSGSVLDGLEGLTTGFNVNFGEEEEKYTLRGITSINSSRSPLFVVDNVPVSAENLELMVNENDIASITVLKDATAASIWGAQAANGVVVIVTRKGQNTGKSLKIGYDGSFTYNGYPDYDYLDYMSSDMFIKNAKQIFSPGYYTWDAVTSQTTGLASGAKVAAVMPHEYPLYRWNNGDITEAECDRLLGEMAARNNRSQIEKQLMSPKLFTRHSLSFMGGGNSYTVYGSLSYEFNQDNTRNKFNKYALNVRQDFRLAPWLSLDLTTTVSVRDNKNAIQPLYTPLENLLPYMMLQDADGNNLSHADLLMYEPDRLERERQAQFGLDYVPMDEVREGYDKRNEFATRLNAGVTVRFMEGFTYEGRFAYQRNGSKAEAFNSQKSYVVREELAMFTVADPDGGSPTYYLPNTGGKLVETNGYQNNWTVRNQLNFDRTLGDHQITALGGMEIQSNRTTNTINNIRGYDPQTMTAMQYDELTLSKGLMGAILPDGDMAAYQGNRFSSRAYRGNETEYRFVSFYANSAYTFRHKYSFNGSIRFDQSNLFGSDPSVQWKPVWSLGLNWNMRREGFMENAHAVDRLNVRLSYGLSGNSPNPGEGGGYDILYPNTNSLYSGLGIGYRVLTPANKTLRWERTQTVNFGTDFSLWSGALSGSLDVYRKYTTDLLTDAPMNPVGGWFSALANMGDMSNTGFELMLNSRNISTENFTWRTSLILSYNRNKIEKLYIVDPLTPSSAVYKRFREGYAANSIFAYQFAGLDEMGDPLAYDSDGTTKVKFTSDMTDASAVKYMGTSQPPWFGSLSNQFRYRNFELSFMFVYNLGHKMRNDTGNFFSGRASTNIHRDFDRRWTEDNKNTNVPSYVASTSESGSRRTLNFYTQGDVNVVSASYIKLRDLTFAYSLPKRICDKLSAESIKLRVQAINLFYWAANNEGIDPEAQNYSGSRVNWNGSGIRTNRFGPSWSVGLSVNFK